jgi:hypothetical protein
MNKAQKAAQAANVAALAHNFPGCDAVKLQNDLFKLAIKCEANAICLCNTPDHIDQRDMLRHQLRVIAQKHGIELRADVSGDPRGYCLKLHLPDGAYNTMGGAESGYGIGSL